MLHQPYELWIDGCSSLICSLLVSVNSGDDAKGLAWAEAAPTPSNEVPDSFLDEIRAPAAGVAGGLPPRALEAGGARMVGLSPFNKEKTPSFTVNDQKGFYHCFSSGKHGDIFGFVMETEGLSFPEAVEKLAGEAGLEMPKPDPQFERVAKERLGLLDALEAAAAFFQER